MITSRKHKSKPSVTLGQAARLIADIEDMSAMAKNPKAIPVTVYLLAEWWGISVEDARELCLSFPPKPSRPNPLK